MRALFMRASIVERAFQLASSGRCPTLYKLEQLLASEGYDLVVQHLSGPSIRQEIRRRIREAGKARPISNGDDFGLGTTAAGRGLDERTY